MSTRMEDLNFINMDINWTVKRKGRTTITRCPRKLVAHAFKLAKKIHESAAFERNKKRKLLHQLPSLSPQTPSGHSHSLSQSMKTKSKTRLRASKILKPTNKKVRDPRDDFSGIQLLADVACSSFVNHHVEDFSISKENKTPLGIQSCTVAQSNGFSVQQSLQDIGKEGQDKKVAPSRELRLHWDLNTVMDEWEEPCDDLLIEPQLSMKHDAAISLVPLIENSNNPTVEETNELMDTNKISIKTSDGESSATKSDVDSLARPGKCEDFSSSTTSVLMEANFEAERIGNPLVRSYSKVAVPASDKHSVSEEAMQGFCYNKITTDHASECCGSNVTQEEQGHMAEGDSEDKLQAGYDSPFEDGELRELIGKTEKETAYESDKIYKDDLGTIENLLSNKVDADNQTSLLGKEAIPNNEIKPRVQVDTYERPHFDESRKDFCGRKDGHDDESTPVGRNLLQTSFDVSRNGGEYIQRSRSSTSDFSMRVRDLKSHRILDSNYSRNSISRGGGYRTHDKRPSPSERNNGYGSYRGPPPARSHSRDRFRFHSQEYSDLKPCYSERKPRFSSNFNRHVTRSRSGSPIAWHFQKRKNTDTSNSGEVETATRGGHVSPERSSKCFDDRRYRDGQFRENRQSSVTIKQRFDPIRCPERFKSDDYFRFTQRPARFSLMTGYKYKDRQ